MAKVKWIKVEVQDPRERKIKAQPYAVTKLPVTRTTSKLFLEMPNDEEIKKRIVAVIKEEAPITEWLLIKRVINSFGIQKAGVHIRTKMFDVLDNMKLKIEEEYDQQIYWRSSQVPQNYRIYRTFTNDDESHRDVTNVPIIEISNAIAETLEENERMDYESLVRETACKLGYTRLGKNVTQAMKRGVQMACERYPIKKDGSNYCYLR